MYQITLKPRDAYTHWRSQADYWHLSAKGRQKLEWLIFYHTVGKRNALSTAVYFSISPKTFHKWKKRFRPDWVLSLEEHARTPIHQRTWQVTSQEEANIIRLRNQYLSYGKVKLKLLYYQHYQQSISTWKIERVIRKHQLYADPLEQRRKVRRFKQRQQKPKIRINQLKGLKADCPAGTLWHVDSIILWWYGQRRVILTALEDKTRLGFARVYQTASSRTATDFLKRLVYLTDSDVRIVHSDNGAEFAGEFAQACQDLRIQQVYSRLRTPKDNPCLERFNRTIQDEWLAFSEVGLDVIPEANLDLTAWLIEYNQNRPHQALDYQTPLEYAQQNYFKVLPMWSASTRY